MQGPVAPGSSLTAATVEQRLTAVEGRLASLEKLLVIANDGSLTIKSVAKVSLQAPTVDVKTGISFTLSSGSTIDVKSGTQLTIASGATAELKAGAQLSINAGGTASVKAGVLVLNNGTKPLARLGDAVAGNTITGGTATILG